MKAALNLEGLPTIERFDQSGGYFDAGGDERSGRVYRFKDSAVERTYANLIAKETSEEKRSDLRAELLALERYFVAYSEGGLHGSMPSVDWAAAGASNPSGRDHTAKTDYAMDKRDEYRGATLAMSADQRIVAQWVVLAGQSPERAGYEIGRKSRRRASEAAVNVLRSAGEALSTYFASKRR